MSANIFGDRFYGRRTPAWHGLGTTFDGDISASAAVQNAGLDYQIYLLPAYVSAGGADIELPGRRVIMREPVADDPVWRQLGTNLVSENYTFLQNTEVASLMNPLSDIWPVETVGALGAGETIFLTLKAGGMTVGGDELENYFLISDVRDGGTTMKIAFTPVRVVCQNTLVSGLKQATVSVNLAHQPGMGATVKNYADLVKSLRGSVDGLKAAFDRMAATPIDDAGKLQVFTAAYPDPARPKKLDYLPENSDIVDLYEERTAAEETFAYYGSRAAAYRSAADELFGKFNEEFPVTAGTAWAAYNAVVEMEDFRNGGARSNQSALFGARATAKKRAFAAALAIAR